MVDNDGDARLSVEAVAAAAIVVALSEYFL